MGDSDEAQYATGLDALLDGWRLLQMSQLLGHEHGHEYTTGYLPYEFLFERLVVRWEIAGTPPIAKQKELLARFRFASADERAWIRGVLREHLAEHFPEMQAP